MAQNSNFNNPVNKKAAKLIWEAKFKGGVTILVTEIEQKAQTEIQLILRNFKGFSGIKFTILAILSYYVLEYNM